MAWSKFLLKKTKHFKYAGLCEDFFQMSRHLQRILNDYSKLGKVPTDPVEGHDDHPEQIERHSYYSSLSLFTVMNKSVSHVALRDLLIAINALLDGIDSEELGALTFTTRTMVQEGVQDYMDIAVCNPLIGGELPPGQYG